MGHRSHPRRSIYLIAPLFHTGLGSKLPKIVPGLRDLPGPWLGQKGGWGHRMQSCVVCRPFARKGLCLSCIAIAFPFPELAEGALVVDVGGGIGSTTLRLAERFPKLRFIVQDREPVCRLGEDVWLSSFVLLYPGAHRPRRHGIFTALP